MVNDERIEIDEQTTVAALLESLGFPDRGIAVAVDWAVLPRRIGTQRFPTERDSRW